MIAGGGGVAAEARGCMHILSSRVFLYKADDKQKSGLCSVLAHHDVALCLASPSA